VPGKGDTLVFKERWQDGAGRWWTAKAYFAPTADARVVKCTHELWCTGSAHLLRYEGPMTSVGDGTFGPLNNGLHPPEGPATERAASALKRAAPDHDGVLAVESPDGPVLGMMWDPSLQWCRGMARPQALMAAPNVLTHQANSFLSLLVPGFAVDQPATDAGTRTPFDLSAGRLVFLRSELFVAAQGGLSVVEEAYRQRFAPGGPGRALMPGPDAAPGQTDSG
jgi:hypothetical protein